MTPPAKRNRPAGGAAIESKLERILAEASVAARAGNYENAMERCGRVLKRDRHNPRALFLAGNCAMALGRHGDAAKWLERAVRQQSSSPEIFNNLGAAYLNDGRPDAACKAFAKALALRPEYANAHVNLANALRATEDLEGAERHLLEALALSGEDARLLAELGEVRAGLGRPAKAAEAYRKALAHDPGDRDLRLRLVRQLVRAEGPKAALAAARQDPSGGRERAERLTAYGEALNDLRQSVAAVDLLQEALQHEPRYYPAWSVLDTIYQRVVPRWHFSMLNDTARNDAYDAAIGKLIRPGDLVLDIGAGSGLLAMMAVRAGAGHVYCCEGVAPIAQKAREIVAANGFADRITVLNKWSNELVPGRDIPHKADVLISEIVDNVLIGEGVVPSLKHAFAELVTPDARVIPRGGSINVMPVESEMIRNMGQVGEAAGFDVTPFNEFSRFGYVSYRARPGDMRVLAPAQQAFAFGFTRKVLEVDAEERVLEFTAERDGTLHAAVVWIDLALDDEIVINEPPEGGGGHWLPAFFLNARPRLVKANQTIHVVASHDTANLHVIVE